MSLISSDDLTQDLLADTEFPLGEITKTETRRIAAEFGLTTADKPESQDLCLVESNGSMRAFLDKYIAPQKVALWTSQGGCSDSTTACTTTPSAKRKGTRYCAPEPLYVIELDAAGNRVIVGDRQLAVESECTVQKVNWVSVAAPTAPIGEVQIRYRLQTRPGYNYSCRILPKQRKSGATRVKLIFDEPQLSITPGQAAVWYDGDVLLGGGILERNQLPN